MWMLVKLLNSCSGGKEQSWVMFMSRSSQPACDPFVYLSSKYWGRFYLGGRQCKEYPLLIIYSIWQNMFSIRKKSFHQPATSTILRQHTNRAFTASISKSNFRVYFFYPFSYLFSLSHYGHTHSGVLLGSYSSSLPVEISSDRMQLNYW